jgi:HEPN domain-containing protein
VNAGAGNYDSAVYSLEMSVEIAFKAVLLALGVEAPKTHAVGDALTIAVAGGMGIPKELKENVRDYVETFNALLDLRAAGGYMYEGSLSMDDLRRKYESNIAKAEKIVGLCGTAVGMRSGKKK